MRFHDAIENEGYKIYIINILYFGNFLILILYMNHYFMSIIHNYNDYFNEII